MMGLAALPLADIESIRFSAPMMITLLSVFMLGEKVGSHRWLALMVGFIGVLFIVRPGSATFNLGSIFILISVLFYALTVMITRKLHATDSSATMAYYSSLVYLSALGLVWAGWTYFMARAYSLAQASVAAPFEYLSLPINVMWGFTIWREIPTLATWVGALLTLLSGIYILYRDRK